MDLTSTTAVKARLSELAGVSTYDTLLGTLITAVSGQAERLMNRGALATSRTELFDVKRYQTEFHLYAPTVTATTSVKLDLDRDFGASTALDSDTYYVDPATGILYLDVYPSVYGRKCLQVVYTGGMAANATAFQSTYPAASDAVAKQVAFLFQRRDQLGITSETTQGESMAVASQDWLPEVRDALMSLRRMGRR